MTSQPQISVRKADHLDLCTDGDVAFRTKTNLFEQVGLVHVHFLSSLPTRSTSPGSPARPSAPVFIAAMTGGRPGRHHQP